MKQQHRYRLTLSQLPQLSPADDAAAQQSLQPAQPLSFEVDSHDDILMIVGLARQRGDFGADEAAALVVGLKLLGGVMLQHREHPLFEEFFDQFVQFMKRLKKDMPPASPASIPVSAS